MFKNVASQQIVLLAIDTATNTPKTGDAANITAYLSKDYGTVTVLGDTSATEMDATNAPGLYRFDVTQTESNCDVAVFSGKSSTSGVRIVPVTVFMRPANATALSIDSSGRVDMAKLAGQTITAAAGVTFPSSIASPTNITAGTITTVTNLTNAPTNGDFTATMKTSITTAATAATPSVTVSDKTGFKLASDGLGLVTTWTVGITGDITGNLSGSIGSVATGGITSTSFAAGAIDAAAIATDAIGSNEISAAAVTKIQSGLSTYAGGDTAGTATLLSRITATRAGYIDNLSGGAVMLESSYTAPPSAATISTQVQTDLGTGSALTALASQSSVNTLAGYVDTEVAAIKAKTDNLPAQPAAVGDIPTAIQNANAKFDLADAIETGVTERMAFRLVVATLGGKSNGADTNTPTFRNLSDTKDVVSAETDDVGNRLTVTRDLT